MLIKLYSVSDYLREVASSYLRLKLKFLFVFLNIGNLKMFLIPRKKLNDMQEQEMTNRVHLMQERKTKIDSQAPFKKEILGKI